MVNVIITTASTTPQTFNVFGDNLIVTSTGALSTDSARAVTTNFFMRITVQGTISSFEEAVSIGNGAQIAIGAGGVISASNVALFMNEGSGSNSLLVTNAGSLIAGSGIDFSGRSLELLNSGSITGFNDAGVRLASLDDPAIIRNSGLIDGGSFGIISTGTQSELITNSGIIGGRDGAMNLSDAEAVITNTGTIDGAIFLNGGADRFNGSGGVQGDVFGGGGNDTIYGGAADDAVFGEADADRLRGGGGEDSLFGGLGNDTASGNAGDDIVNGDEGLDLLYGGDGDDTVNGGIDADRVYGGAGDDVVFGGAGNDTLYGGAGDDTISGSTGTDVFVFNRNQGVDVITTFSDGTDKLDLRAFDFAALSAVQALASVSSQGLRIDLPGEGMIFLGGFTLAQLTAGDVIL
jgi:Ca2+-binding RTX toxin-like protein